LSGTGGLFSTNYEETTVTNDRNALLTLALATGGVLYVAVMHPVLIPALTLTAAVFVALLAFLKL